MVKFFEIFALVFSINFAHGCNDIDGTTVDSKSHPEANGCYVFDKYYTSLNTPLELPGFKQENGSGTLTPIGDKWVIQIPDGPMCTLSQFPYGNPSGSDISICENEKGNVWEYKGKTEFSCGCASTEKTVDEEIESVDAETDGGAR